MQIQLNILFQINICPTAFPLAITHRKYLSPMNHRPLTHSLDMDGCANPKPGTHPQRRTTTRQSASRVFATSHEDLAAANYEDGFMRKSTHPASQRTVTVMYVCVKSPQVTFAPRRATVARSAVNMRSCSLHHPHPQSSHSTSLIIIHCQQLICICSWSKSVQSLFVVLFVSGEGGNKYKYPNVQGKVLLCSCLV